MQLTLGTALAILGVVVLLALALHGWWSTRRSNPRIASDSILQADRVEPALDGTAADALATDHAGPDTVPNMQHVGAMGHGGHGGHGGHVGQAGHVEPVGHVGKMSHMPRVAARRIARLDALIDAIVPLQLESPISGEMVLQHQPPTRRAGSKPFYIEGLDTDTGDWDAPAPGRRYSELQAGVQMASRSGPLNEIEYSEFMQKVQAFAEGVGATVDGATAPDMLDVVARARELDALTSPLDAQLTLTLRSKSVAWSVGYVQQCAARHGFVAGAVPGRLVVPSPTEDSAPSSPPLLALTMDAQAAMAALGDDPQAAAVREFSLSLDVPQTAASAEPFPAWHHAANALATDMDASVVDDRGHPVAVAAFAAISQDLDQLYAQLQALDLPAGSPAARRLFS